ncbi:NADH-ubiquinone oxidoreductase chain I, partial [hydrothermal vent metagenome]
MPIGVKKVHRNAQLTIWEKLYIPEVLHGMSITLRHFAGNITGSVLELFGGPKHRKVMTIYYPEESLTPPPAYRGRPVLVVGDNGLEKCVACGLCEAACPAHCISIVGAERNDLERYPLSYTLDGSRCIFCGLCEEA